MISIFNTYDELSDFAARQIISTVQQNPAAVLCLAAGDTPRLAYQKMAALAHQRNISFADVTFIGLDEWVAIAPAVEGSCYHFLNEIIFKPLSIKEERIFFFNSMAADLEAECKHINSCVDKLGLIDITLAGVGMNGHIGFNEPGIDPELKAHVVTLDAVTTSVGQKYFKQEKPLTKGISLGMVQIMASRKVLLLANGFKKAAIIRRTMVEDISNAVPASLIRNHPNAMILLDKEAACEL
jgi:glucosamine-6-phosphate isomerase